MSQGPPATASSAGSMVTTAGWDARFCASPGQRAHLLDYARLPERSSACLPRTVAVVPTHKSPFNALSGVPNFRRSLMLYDGRSSASERGIGRQEVRLSCRSRVPRRTSGTGRSRRKGIDLAT